jgi:hypothetical protein
MKCVNILCDKGLQCAVTVFKYLIKTLTSPNIPKAFRYRVKTDHFCRLYQPRHVIQLFDKTFHSNKPTLLFYQYRQRTCNVTLRSVRVPTVVVEQQQVLHILSVCL